MSARRSLIRVFAFACGCAALAALAGCRDRPFSRPARLGGKLVPASVLNEGHRVYAHYCLPCHGARGDGHGPSSAGLWPPPRDFRSASFKFAGTRGQELPSDAALARIIRSGLRGTAMLGWDLPKSELFAVIQYIKTFSPAGQGFRDSHRKVAAPKIPPDPYTTPAAIARARKRGDKLYHTLFQCDQCHPSYESPQRFKAWGSYPPRLDHPYLPVPKWSDTYHAVLLPPDFLRTPLRSIRRNADGSLRADDFYRVVAYGLQGPMPGYGTLGAKKVWAIVHYVKRLAEKRGTAAGRALHTRLMALPQMLAPPPPAPPPDAGAD